MPSQFPWTNHGRCHTTPGTSSSPRTHLPGTNADWTTCGTARTTTLWASPPRRPSRAPLAPGAKARKPLWSPAAERRDDGTRTRDRRLDTNPRSSQRPGPMRKARSGERRVPGPGLRRRGAAAAAFEARRSHGAGPPEVVAGAVQLPDATAPDGVMSPVRMSQTQGVSGGAPPWPRRVRRR